jgi:hypothetical protein
LADEKKDVIVPSAGNEKLQPGKMFESVGNQSINKGLDDGDMFARISQTEKFNSSVAASAAAEKKEETLKVVNSVKIPPTEKKPSTAGPPIRQHKGIHSSGVNSHIKNSSFGRGVPFSSNADYGPMWKNTSRLASSAIGDGNPNISRIGLHHGTFGLNGMTISPFSWDGAVPLSATMANVKGLNSTFSTMQDEDQ